jgi:hypothetical protein
MTATHQTGRDLAVIRTGAAHKAWATRRERGWAPKAHGDAHNPRPKSAAEEALAAFELQAESTCPDWHAAALKLRAALRGPASAPVVVRVRPQPKPLAIVAPAWPDYNVERGTWNTLQWPSPILVVIFADGEVVRAPAVSLRGRPVNVGRGLRLAIAFYTSRRARRTGLRDLPGTRPATPEITSCVCEDNGQVYDAGECSGRTVGARAAQDWKVGRNRHGR